MSTPNIRFKQNNGDKFPDWKEIKIKNLGEFRRGQTYSRNQTTLDKNATFIVRSSNLIDSWFVDFSKNKQFANIKIQNDDLLQLGDVVICTANGSTSLVGKSSIYNGKYAGSISWGAFCSVFRSNKDAPLAKYFFRTHRYRKLINFMKQGGNGALGNLNVREISNTSILFPCTEEQQKIASFFSTLDQKIDLNEQKLEALEKLKKGVMQKIFDQEFSFKNKEGKEFPEWEKAYLKDILLFQNGINTGKENFGTGIKLISVNEVLSPFPIKYDDISSSVMVDDNLGKKFSVTYGDVLFQRSSETREDAGTSNVYIDNTREAVFGGFVIRGKRIGDYNPIFLHELLRSSKVRQQIIKYAQGAQHINIGQESLEKIEIKLPCREEQEKIAELAIALYKKIELLTNKLKGLKNLKKGFMQQMFV